METVIVKFGTGSKQYCFNAEGLNVGDKITSDKYSGQTITVVRKCSKAFKYYNELTGDLSDEPTSTRQFEIKTLKPKVKEDIEVVYYTKIEE